MDEPTPTERVRAIVEKHLLASNIAHPDIVQCCMEALREAKPIIAEIIDRERNVRPEVVTTLTASAADRVMSADFSLRSIRSDRLYGASVCRPGERA